MPRPYSGTAGRVEHCQIGVLVAYAISRGRTCIDRELSLPQRWAEEWDRRREAGGPDEVTVATKPQLAQGLLAPAMTAGVEVSWVTGDAVYGSDPGVRRWMEAERPAYVLAVRRHARVWMSTGVRLRQGTSAQVAARMRRCDWQRLSTGEGAQVPRLYDGAVRPLAGPVDPGWGRGLLVRRRLSEPTELAYDVVYGPVTTPVAEMVRVAGSRWAIEERLETATGEVGRDRDERRRWRGWSRQITLALLAHAYLTVTRVPATAAAQETGGPCVRPPQTPGHACPKRSWFR